jgi:hypothetical protein
MRKAARRSQLVPLVGVVVLAVVMPGLLRLVNRAVSFLVGAEGRLAAISVETSRPLGPMPKVWAGLAQGGENLESFMSQAGPDIAKLQPEYIRIDHVYDGFGVVRRGDGGLEYDWSRLDKVITDILQTGAKPFLSLSYMPEAIASTDILSEPKNWNEWSQTVRATIEHYSGTWGIDGVYYEVWNEPDLFGKWRMGGRKDYRNLYYFAAVGAAGAQKVKDFKLGGPATTGLYRNWMDNFFPFILNNHLRLDFFSWHRYDLDPKQYAVDTASVDKWIEGQPYFSQVEKIITEMGPEARAGGVNDMQMGAAHLVAVDRELIGRVKYGFSFAVSGNWGIVGKPRYTALEYLARLGPDRLALTGEGTWVRAMAAKSGNKYQVVIANYDVNKTHTEVVPVSFLGLKDSKFVLRKQLIGQQATEENVATTEAVLQTSVLMPANSVMWIELEPD